MKKLTAVLIAMFSGWITQAPYAKKDPDRRGVWHTPLFTLRTSRWFHHEGHEEHEVRSLRERGHSCPRILAG
jgi:hypothetical protein